MTSTATDVAISKDGVCQSGPFSEIETPTMLSTSINADDVTDFLVSHQSGVKESAQMVNPPEDIAAVATSSPTQPTNIKYPVTFYSNKPRSFNPTWFKLYSWLEYSVKQDVCFCFPCRMFGSSGRVSTSRPEKTFKVLGFKDWKHATGKDRTLKGHENSYAHKQAVVAWKEFKKMDSSIVDTLGGARQEQVQKNRHYLKTLCKIILLCSNQEIALRGHRENDASTNKGNFIEILNLVAKHDEVVSNRLSHLPRNAIYTSPKVQNDLLHIMADIVRKEIALAVQNAGVFLFQLMKAKIFPNKSSWS